MMNLPLTIPIACRDDEKLISVGKLLTYAAPFLMVMFPRALLSTTKRLVRAAHAIRDVTTLRLYESVKGIRRDKRCASLFPLLRLNCRSPDLDLTAVKLHTVRSERGVRLRAAGNSRGISVLNRVLPQRGSAARLVYSLAARSANVVDTQAARIPLPLRAPCGLSERS